MLPKCVTRKEIFSLNIKIFSVYISYIVRAFAKRLSRGTRRRKVSFPFYSRFFFDYIWCEKSTCRCWGDESEQKKSERNFPFSLKYPKDCLNNKNELENVRSDSSSIPGILRGCWEKYSRKLWKFFHHTLERRAEVRWSNNIKTLYYIYSFPLVADLPYTVYRAIHRAMHVEPNENEMFLMWV